MSTRPRTARGVSLIELMMALGVLATGLVAMWHLHVVGLSSTAAGRRHTVASTLAGELVAGLERLAYDDPLLAEHGTGTSAPTPFGWLVQGDGTLATGAREWSDATPVPGVRRTTEMNELSEITAGYQRRWTVWVVTGNGIPSAKLVAVSVTWNDPPFRRPREVVQYASIANPDIVGDALGGNSP